MGAIKLLAMLCWQGVDELSVRNKQFLRGCLQYSCYTGYKKKHMPYSTLTKIHAL